ncbi:SDR family oxidoreductase [Sulfitobacter dubius]|uniref:SDR family oxidoreductase n=1 Tax=Sulfitobacter dubius TaxID=218673 RepID=UPI0022AE5B87|nr:SDR family oxidoreductase [Sulfitobacter dubius]MCZ4366293.1 SDR family oxidoreductase [Sulfitobacter dubius]
MTQYSKYFSPELLAGKTVLITGGGTGLGLAMGMKFMTLGANIVICGRRNEVLETAASQLRDAGSGFVETYQCDIRSSEEVEAMMESISDKTPIDILVNNAAANFIAQSAALSARAADAILAVTLHGTMYVTLAAGRHWIESGRTGVVLSILSTSTITGRAFTVPSAMAKTALLAMTKSLAVEWGSKGIRLVALAPGNFPTKGAQAQLNPSDRKSKNANEETAIPLGRVGDPDELSDCAAFLVSDAARYMTGEMVVLDGGLHFTGSGAEDLLTWSDKDWAALREQRK